MFEKTKINKQSPWLAYFLKNSQPVSLFSLISIVVACSKKQKKIVFRHFAFSLLLRIRFWPFDWMFKSCFIVSKFYLHLIISLSLFLAFLFLNFFLNIKWAIHGLFSFIFSLFKQNNTIYTTNQCEKMSRPSSILHQESNPRPLKHESSPTTTRPGLKCFIPTNVANFGPSHMCKSWCQKSKKLFFAGHANTLTYWHT